MTDLHSEDQRALLTELARSTIERAAVDRVRPRAELDSLPAWARIPRATFVTVYLREELNGCIGTLEARRPLAEDIVSNAFRAAFEDPRFAPVSPAQTGEVGIHISILGPLAEVPVASEAELLGQMNVGEFGWVLADGTRRGTFLPSVWEKLPDSPSFLAQLKRKAGFLPHEWPSGLIVSRFAVEEF